MSDGSIDTANFTQKDLMQHLLNVAQHAATREDLAEMRKESDDKFNRRDFKIDTVAENLDSKIDTVAEKLDAKIDIVAEKLDAKIDTVAEKLDAKIEAVRKDINANTWRILGGLVVIMTLFSFAGKMFS